VPARTAPTHRRWTSTSEWSAIAIFEPKVVRGALHRADAGSLTEPPQAVSPTTTSTSTGGRSCDPALTPAKIGSLLDPAIIAPGERADNRLCQALSSVPCHGPLPDRYPTGHDGPIRAITRRTAGAEKPCKHWTSRHWPVRAVTGWRRLLIPRSLVRSQHGPLPKTAWLTRIAICSHAVLRRTCTRRVRRPGGGVRDPRARSARITRRRRGDRRDPPRRSRRMEARGGALNRGPERLDSLGQPVGGIEMVTLLVVGSRRLQCGHGMTQNSDRR
jgi:hypothetical protein